MGKPTAQDETTGQKILQVARKRHKIEKLIHIKNYKNTPGWFYSPNHSLRCTWGKAPFTWQDLPDWLTEQAKMPEGIDKNKEVLVEWKFTKMRSLVDEYKRLSAEEKKLVPPSKHVPPVYRIDLCMVFVYDSLHAAGFEVPLRTDDTGALKYRTPAGTVAHMTGKKDLFAKVYGKNEKKKTFGDRQNVVLGDVVVFKYLGPYGHMAIVDSIEQKGQKKIKYTYIDQNKDNNPGRRFDDLEPKTYFLRPRASKLKPTALS